MGTNSTTSVLLAGLAAALIMLGCDQPSNAPTGPEGSAGLGAARPQAATARGAYDLTKVPKTHFAAPGLRAPRGYGASPTLSRAELEALARTSVVINGSFERNGGVGSNDFAG